MKHPHMRLFGTILSLATLLAGPNGVAEEFDMDITLTLLEPTAESQVIGADPASTTDWPATLVFRTRSGGCTATAVGKRVVLTAAHCVADGQKGSITTNGQKARVTCNHHPDYPSPDSSADFALCYSTRDLAFTPYENVNTVSSIGDKDESITLLGFGCIKKNGTDRSFGYLYKGTALATNNPSSSTLYTITKGGAAVCFGDSGGGAYATTATGRVLMGVNSKGDISLFSLLSTTATGSFSSWARNWLDEDDHDGARICGIDPAAVSCAD